MKLYELTEEFDAIADLAFTTAQDGEVDPELSAKLDAIQGEIDKKLAACCRIVKNMHGIEESLKGEVQRLQNKQRAAMRSAESVKKYMLENLEKLGIDKRKVDELFTVSIQDNPPAVVVENIDLVPTDFDLPIAREVNKVAIKNAIQSGKEVPGCKLTQSKHLRIR